MKKILKIAIICLLLAVQSQAQTGADCYRTILDASGIPISDSDKKMLQDSACLLKKTFPEAVRDSFMVIDVGFYAYTDDMEGGTSKAMSLIEQILAENPKAKYYLAFGRETSSDRGPNYKVIVKAKLPRWGHFKCLTEMERSLFQIRLENELKKTVINDVKAYVKAEREVIFKMKNMILKIVDCCDGSREECTQCSSELVDEYFSKYKIRGFEKDAEFKTSKNIMKPNIQDNSSFTITLNGNNNFIGNHLDDFIPSINSKVGVNTQITSNLSICYGNTAEYENFIKEKEFGVLINIDKKTTIAPKNIKITAVWNADKKNIFSTDKEANVFIEGLISKIAEEIGQQPSVSPNPLNVEYPFCQKTSFVGGGQHDIKWFIDEVKKEEAKCTDAEKRNTKLMFSKFRKIFYNTNGWNKYLIPKTEKITSWYDVVEIPYKGYPKKWHNPLYYIEKVFLEDDYFLYEDREGRPLKNGISPNIYCDNSNCNNFNQEVLLPNNCLIDLGHVFAGIDAINNPDIVSVRLNGQPIPLITCSSNADACTWVGDICSVINSQLREYDEKGCKDLQRSTVSNEVIQNFINENASGADMLGNIDAYVIAEKYTTKSEKNGWLVSEILYDYYLGAGKGYQNKRYSTFAKSIGLLWDEYSTSFFNLKEKTPIFTRDIASASTFFALISAKNTTTLTDWQLLKTGFVVRELYFLSDKEIEKHLNVFFKDLFSKIKEEK